MAIEGFRYITLMEIEEGDLGPPCLISRLPKMEQDHAPRFINQIPSDRDLDPDRQYLCRYVADSSTGFIIFGVTITQELFLKQVYFLGTLLSGICGVLVRAYM